MNHGWKMKLNRLLAYARTMRYLKPMQAVYYVRRRLLPEVKQVCVVGEVRVRSGVCLEAVIPPGLPILVESEFRFLNESRSFDLNCMDWSAPGMSRLWRYNLQYFDYLQDQGRSRETLAKLISSWIEKHPLGSLDAWEPYTVSLRIVNWIKYFLQPEMNAEIPGDWLKSLYQQACWLENNIEYHILANHYLKNGKALLFAGVFFEGKRADGWLTLGLKILSEEAQEQILADGGHYERSPMYHAIVVEDYLDALNLIQSCNVMVARDALAFLKSRVIDALDFLLDLQMPDAEIPLFNDAAFGIAPSPRRLVEYAGKVAGYVPGPVVDGLSVCAKAASGYYVVRDGDSMLVVDCGAVGPDYQPGHAHCDTLSYELALGGRRMVVDSGVHDYENGPERYYARSTRAHNTVSVDGSEQSEIWGAFRVARRAYPLGTPLLQRTEHGARFEGAHDGFLRLPGNVVHRRTIGYDADGSWTVSDRLHGDRSHAMESYIHLHPDFTAEVLANSIVVLTQEKLPFALIEVEGASIRLEKGWYFPEFGIRIANSVIVLSCEGKLPLQLTYCIRKK